MGIGDGAACNGYFWFSNVNANGLFRIDITSKKIEFVNFFPNVSADSYFLHKRCFEYHNRLFFIPALSRRIDIYDIWKNEFSSIPFENDIAGEAILDAIPINQILYIFPRNRNCEPIMLNMETFEIRSVEGFADEINKYASKDNPEKFYRTCEYDGKIVFPISETDIIAVWNPNDDSFQTIHTRFNNIINVVAYDKHLYFTIREEYGLSILDLESSEIESISIKRPTSGKSLYGCILIKDDSIVCAPSFGEYIHGYMGKSMSFEIKLDDSIAEYYKFFKAQVVKDDIWFLPMGIEELYVLDSERLIHHYSLLLDDIGQKKYKAKLLEKRIESREVLMENDEYTLNCYLALFNEKGI